MTTIAGLRPGGRRCSPGCRGSAASFISLRMRRLTFPNGTCEPRSREAVRGIFAAPTRDEAVDEAQRVAKRYRSTAPEFSAWLLDNVEECLQVYAVPASFRQRLRTVNPLEVLNREIKRRTHVARIFPNGDSLLRLATAVLVEIHDSWIESPMPYLNMKKRSQQEPRTVKEENLQKGSCLIERDHTQREPLQVKG